MFKPLDAWCDELLEGDRVLARVGGSTLYTVRHCAEVYSFVPSGVGRFASTRL